MEKTVRVQLEIKVPIEINLDSLGGINGEDIAKHTRYLLSNWSDGRYPFEVELFTRGLHNLVKMAITDSIRTKQMDICPDQYVNTENSSVALWSLLSDDLAKKIQFYFDSENWSINICPN
jgi:hypothetical protein